ncbi:O-Glycosyl hydrolase [Salibacterium halotolerans]|uniref:O-Glycosyl hydrolase n=2 Tax=Salibacterium halotolerans TaxID=1884432 RepID=A0A1I5L2L3_9BACI|nr:O-Glycosyl hydrolase [Salibacterium halotolerans]
MKCFKLSLTILIAVSPFTSSYMSGHSSAEEGTDPETIKVDPGYQHESFEGWGTALTWFANVTGGWPDEIKEDLADELYGEKGLQFNISRYNIGGGDAPETEPYMRLGGAVPGYWNRPEEFSPPEDAGDDWEEEENWWNPENPDHWNWDADANQRWWLQAAKERGADTFEAFSNSPPYFMTRSGLVSGNWDPWEDNIQPDKFENFATYLTTVVDHLEKDMGIEFDTLSPVNEPNNGYWGAMGRQEGSNWSPSSQVKIINEVKEKLDAKNMDTVVSGMDETNPERFRHNWNQYGSAARDNLGQLNVHTYWPEQRASIRDIAKAEEKELWMSEVDLGPSGIPQDFDDIRPALSFSERIQGDVQELEPKAWVMWQAIEDKVNMNENNENMNWGLIHVDFDPESFEGLNYYKNKKYYAMGHYSKFIRPGDHFINTNNSDTLAAVSKEDEKLVLVHTNHSKNEKEVEFDLSSFSSVEGSVTPHVTSETENLKEKESFSISDEHFSDKVPAQSITTYVVDGVSGVDAGERFLNERDDYKIVNKNSGKVMDLSEEGNELVQRTKQDDQPSQKWSIEKVTEGYSSKEYYTIMNKESGRVIGLDNGSIVQEKEAEGAGDQQWLLSTSGDKEYTFLNDKERDLLEIPGESTEENAELGLWEPNAGDHQVWELIRIPNNYTFDDLRAEVDQAAINSPGIRKALLSKINTAEKYVDRAERFRDRGMTKQAEKQANKSYDQLNKVIQFMEKRPSKHISEVTKKELTDITNYVIEYELQHFREQ